MQDDEAHGGHAPMESHREGWQPSGSTRHDNAGLTDRMGVGLTAVVLAVHDEQPVVLATVPKTAKGQALLPSGRFCPRHQPSLETALRDAVLAETGHELGFVEQLVTGCEATASTELRVSYLALDRVEPTAPDATVSWINCYDLLPWEDFRSGRPQVLDAVLLPRLEGWIRSAGDATEEAHRREDVAIAFGIGGRSWDDQRVADRYDLAAGAGITVAVPARSLSLSPPQMHLVAEGLGRLRAKVRYRPIVFELLAPEFTLFELQRTVEAVLGPTLHKQNFRRLVEGTGLVEPTGDIRNNTGGRPAKTFRFRREVLLERPAPGVHVRPGRAA